jgi:hypothetical protein
MCVTILKSINCTSPPLLLKLCMHTIHVPPRTWNAECNVHNTLATPIAFLILSFDFFISFSISYLFSSIYKYIKNYVMFIHISNKLAQTVKLWLVFGKYLFQISDGTPNILIEVFCNFTQPSVRYHEIFYDYFLQILSNPSLFIQSFGHGSIVKEKNKHG